MPYQQDPETRVVISQLLALQFLPAEHIPATFNMMQEKASTERLGELFNMLSRPGLILMCDLAYHGVFMVCQFRPTMIQKAGITGSRHVQSGASCK